MSEEGKNELRLAKEYLLEYKMAELRIRVRKSQLAELMAAAASLGSPTSGSGGRKTVRRAAAFEGKIDAAEDIIAEIRNDIRDAQKKKDLIIRQIHRLDRPEHIILLDARYIGGRHPRTQSWGKVWETMQRDGYFYAQDYIARRLHAAALRDFYTTNRREILQWAKVRRNVQ